MRIRIAERGAMIECTGSREDVLYIVGLIKGRVIVVLGDMGEACAAWSPQ